METPLCVFPNYPNPLHILSHTHRDTHTKHKKTHKHTHIHTHTFGLTIPLPPSMHTNTANSHPVTHSFSLGSVRKTLYWYSQRAREVSWPRWWPAGVWSWRGCVCPPLWSGRGGPRWGAPSWASLGSSPPETHKQFKKKKKKLFFECTAHNLGPFATEREQDFHFSFFFGSGSGSPSNYTQGSRLSNATREAYQTRGTTCCSSVVTQDWCCIELSWRFCTLEFFCNISLNLFSL